MSIHLRLVSVVLLAVASAQAQSGQRDRGEYLAKYLSMCVQCHSPRGPDGRLIEGELFLGAPLPLEVLPDGWAARAPRIARLPAGWSSDDLVDFLQTGKRPDGTSPQRPMPPFRMNRPDAAAIAAYLESLATTKRY